MELSQYFSEQDIQEANELLRNRALFYTLSKSTYIRGKQCAKSLYLNKHKKGERDELTPETKQLFKDGRSFEKEYRALFKDGINLNDLLGIKFHLYPFYTQKLMQQKRPVIFEAGFRYNKVLVLVDVLILNPDGSYSIHEVKNAPEIKPVFLNDLAIQYYVISNFISNIKDFCLVTKDATHKFKVTDLKTKVTDAILSIDREVRQFKNVLFQEEPTVEMGLHCNIPYKCDFMGYCNRIKIEDC